MQPAEQSVTNISNRAGTLDQVAPPYAGEIPPPGAARLGLFAFILALERVRFVSYPNSGRTWLRVMLGDLGLFPRFTHAGAKGRARNTADLICNINPKYRLDQIVFLMRDPMDTLVSHYFGASLKGRHWHGSLKEFIRHPHYGIERIVCFHQGWYNDRTRFRQFRLLKYEDIRANPCSRLAALLQYLRVPGIEPGQITLAVRLASFDNMKRRESSGELDQRFPDRFRYEYNQNPNRMKVRKGVIGGYQEHLDVDDIEYCRSVMKRYRYDYDSFQIGN